jgi:hypothetical protein
MKNYNNIVYKIKNDHKKYIDFVESIDIDHICEAKINEVFGHVSQKPSLFCEIKSIFTNIFNGKKSSLTSDFTDDAFYLDIL